MKTIKDLLTEEEIEDYHEQWAAFSEKYKLEMPYNVHSNLPIIGRVFQFEDRPIFRAHIFKRRLRKAFDPYFISKGGYFHPFFHTAHYAFPLEQAIHVSLSRLIPGYGGYIITDRLSTKRPPIMKEKVSFDRNAPSSIEVIPGVTTGEKEFIFKTTGTFYDDRTNSPLQIWYFEGVGEQRKYVQNIERLRQGDREVLKALERQIRNRESKHKGLLKPRKLRATATELINSLKRGEIPEAELHDYFSFWEPTPKQP